MRIGLVALSGAFLMVSAGGCDYGIPENLQAGHPLESTIVADWKPLTANSISVDFRFRDDAPSYGCTAEAFDENDTSIGFVVAPPWGGAARTIIMELDDGVRSKAVADVRVTDCDI